MPSNFNDKLLTIIANENPETILKHTEIKQSIKSCTPQSVFFYKQDFVVSRDNKYPHSINISLKKIAKRRFLKTF